MTIRPRTPATAEALDALPKTFSVSRAAAGSTHAGASSDEVDLDASGSSSRALDLHRGEAQGGDEGGAASGEQYHGVFCNYFSIGARAPLASDTCGDRWRRTKSHAPPLYHRRRGQQDCPRIPSQTGGGAREIHLPVPKPPLVRVVRVQRRGCLLLAAPTPRHQHCQGAPAAASMECPPSEPRSCWVSFSSSGLATAPSSAWSFLQPCAASWSPTCAATPAGGTCGDPASTLLAPRFASLRLPTTLSLRWWGSATCTTWCAAAAAATAGTWFDDSASPQTALVSMNCCVKGQRLAQCAAVRIELDAGGYLQMDGEPWTQEPATIEISHHGVSSVLRAQ